MCDALSCLTTRWRSSTHTPSSDGSFGVRHEVAGMVRKAWTEGTTYGGKKTKKVILALNWKKTGRTLPQPPEKFTSAATASTTNFGSAAFSSAAFATMDMRLSYNSR